MKVKWNGISRKAFLLRRGLASEMQHPRCGIFAEDVQHLITECHWSKQVWSLLEVKIGINLSEISIGNWWKTVGWGSLQEGNMRPSRSFSSRRY